MDHGVERPLTRGTDQATYEDIPHCYECALAAWNGGAMDGFNQTDAADRWAYTQLHKDQLPNYWAWARSNVLFDNVFASAQGPSFPNHLYTIAAQSGGAHDNPRRKPGLGSLTFGCDAPPEQLVEVVDSEGVAKMVPPVLRLPDRGRPAEPRRDPVVVLRGAGGPEGLHLVGVQRDPPLPRAPEGLAEAHVPGRPGRSTTSAAGSSRPSRGSRRGSSCPSIPSTTSATARTGPRR